MKRALLIIVSAIILLSGAAGCASIATSGEEAGDNPQKSDFNFILKYGTYARNEIDTFQGTYTKDMIMAPSITIELVLSLEEMDAIYQKMVAIDFFNYPDDFKVNITGDIIGIVTPYPSYYFKVEYASGVKELRWEDEITNPDVKADKLRELIDFIRDIVESKAEYQALPEPRSGYL
jgi:hypothetical protein